MNSIWLCWSFSVRRSWHLLNVKSTKYRIRLDGNTRYRRFFASLKVAGRISSIWLPEATNSFVFVKFLKIAKKEEKWIKNRDLIHVANLRVWKTSSTIWFPRLRVTPVFQESQIRCSGRFWRERDRWSCTCSRARFGSNWRRWRRCEARSAVFVNKAATRGCGMNWIIAIIFLSNTSCQWKF